MNYTALMNLTNELQVACELAKQAGNLLFSYYQRFHPTQGQGEKISIQFKSGNEPVTEADYEISALCMERLRACFPQDGILSEELPDDGSRFLKERTWMIDPIDGTKEFIAGRPGFSIMIGLLSQGRPILGVVYAPLLHSLWYATLGQGAFVWQNGEKQKIHVSDVNDLSLSYLLRSTNEFLPAMEQLKKRAQIQKELRIGSIGVKMCLLAQGKQDLYVHLSKKIKLWDTCGPEIIMTEAGGVVTNLKGVLLDYTGQPLFHQYGMIACNQELFPKVKSLVKRL